MTLARCVQQALAEQEEEMISNRLLKRLADLKREKVKWLQCMRNCQCDVLRKLHGVEHSIRG